MHDERGISDVVYISLFSHFGRAARAAVLGLHGTGDIRSEVTVIVSGTAGSTGFLAVQIVNTLGCRAFRVAEGGVNVNT